MINNFEILRPLLQFDNPGDCYFLQILKRRKDNPKMERDMELIDNIFFYSVEDAEKKMSRVINTCNRENARAYLRVNRRNTEKIALRNAQKIIDLIINKDFKAVKNAYYSAAGENHSEPIKRWIVDFDDTDQTELIKLKHIIINLHREIGKGEILNIIKTKNGYHIICNPFNTQEFKKFYPGLDVHKDNPTILYIP